LLLLGAVLQVQALDPVQQSDVVVRILYFHQLGCVHCEAVEAEVLDPLEAQYGSQVVIERLLTTDNPTNYELLIRTETEFEVSPEDRGSPTLVIGDRILIGETPIRDELTALVEEGLAQGGVDWPDIPGLEEVLGGGQSYVGPDLRPDNDNGEPCDEEEEACEYEDPIWIAYFYETGCQECSRAIADIEYLRSIYPQLIYDEFNIYDYDDAALARSLTEQAGRDWESFNTPAIFIGTDALIGGEEITAQSLETLLEKYAPTGAEQTWLGFTADEDQLDDVFYSLGPIAVAVFGLLDGLNPCAFATIVFFVSYLSISGRQGREILAVGAAFTLGVFLAYLAVGLGFYKVLDLLGGLLTSLSRWVYGLTALLCAVLAVLSFLDFLKARRGEIGDMALNLPHALRMRINAVIRKGRQAQTYIAGAFFAGLVVSMLELACTGQVYLPTIIAVMSRPELRVRAILYLLLYNLLFVLPLVVVFVLAYYGTTAKQLTGFLERNAMVVKLGMVVLFTGLALWLGLSLWL
jgi:cytochrome c biogenesis protein CcdA